MTTRIISGVVITIVLVISLLLGGPLLWGLSLAVSEFAFFELQNALQIRKKGECREMDILSFITIILLYIIFLFPKEARWQNMILLLTFYFLLNMFIYVITYSKYSYRNVTGNIFSLIYGPLMLSYVYITWTDFHKGKYIAALIFISAWMCDTFAYFVGSAIGKHKLAPVLSPKKSVEGSMGGILGAAFSGCLYGFILYLLDIYPMEAIWSFGIITGLASIVSQIGDLCASAIKRQENIKDYGWIIPGHGGIMDRFDSVIITSPIIYFLGMYLIKF